jgi:glucokinase
MAAPKAQVSAADAKRPFFMGVDVGGTNIKIGLVDDAGQTIAYKSIRTEQERGAEDACNRIGNVVDQLVEEVRVARPDLARAGLATPGPMDIAGGMILRPGNLPGWWDFPIRDRVSHHVKLPVTFANDANAASYGEFWCGAGKQYDSLVLLTLGTGIGGGIIVRDMLIEGEHSCGSECGHILINPSDDAPMDSLGKRGSLESYCNATAVVDRALAALGSMAVTSLARRRDAGEKITPRLIAEEAEHGDEVARRVIMDTGRWLAIGIVSLIHTIDPDAVLLGGAMNFGGTGTTIGRAFIERIREEVKPRLLEPLREAVKIEFASLGGDAGYIGAAGLARLEYHKKR